MAKQKKWLGRAEYDICRVDCTEEEYFVDAKLEYTSRWALMCPKCYEKYGIAFGQKYGPDKIKICDLHSQ